MKSQDLILIAAAAAVLFLVMKKSTAPKPATTTTGARTVSYGTPNGWQYFTDGTAISPSGEYYYQGTHVYDPAGMYGG